MGQILTAGEGSWLQHSNRCTVDHNRQGHYCSVRCKDTMRPISTSSKGRTILANGENETRISVNESLAQV